MAFKDFIKPFVPYFAKQAYSCFSRFCYRTIGTFYRTHNSSKINNTEFLRLTGFATIIDAVSHFRQRNAPSFLISPKNQLLLTNLIKEKFQESISPTIEFANKILNHTFNLLGSGDINLGRDINWHLDFKSNRCWPIIHPKAIDAIQLNNSSDIIIPWELSRCQHFVTLGKAYWYTHNEKYTQEFKNQIESWIIDNPYGLGVNWLTPMDVAIRACNWIYGWYFFKESSLIDETFVIEFAKSLFQHGKYLKDNLPLKREIYHNHYLAHITGLLYLGFFFQNTEEGKDWIEFAIPELTSEMLKQVNPDGFDFEGSTCYHRLVLEFFFFSTLLAIINDASFSDNYEEIARKVFGDLYVDRLYKMFEFVLYALKPDGVMPQIGDNDNGRLFILSEKDIFDMAYLLNYGAIFFNESKFNIEELGLYEDVLWVFGEHYFDRWTKLATTSIYDIRNKAFHDSGTYIMRSGGIYVMILCKHAGQGGKGGHDHSDALSFELSIDGRDFIIDPGTYSYTGDYKMRNLFRSTLYHNTVIIDNVEINRFKETNIFGMENEAKPRVLKWETNESYWLLEAEHYGYMKLRDPVIHRRKFILDSTKFLLKIDDFLEGEDFHYYEIHYHFPPTPLRFENRILKTDFSEPPNIVILAESEERFNAELKEGWISPSYGIKTKSRYLCYSGKGKLPINFTTTIRYYQQKNGDG